MKKIFLVISAIIIMMPFATKAFADTSDLVIARLQVGSAASASDEVVQLYNNSTTSIDLSDISIEYKSATGTTWIKRATVANGTTLAPFKNYTLVSLQTADAKLTPGMATAGGNVRVVDSSGAVLDQIAWGNGDSPLGTALAAPIHNEVFVRMPVENSQVLQDTSNNQSDFILQAVGSDGSNAGESSSVTQSLPVQITELFPDPISPQTDSNDEFVELFNPNAQAVNLSGWKLRDSGGKTFALGNVSINPNQYLAFYSKQTKISLNNDGDTITLLDSNGNEIDTTPSYDKAKAGLSWGLTEDGWAWTVSPTPNGVNSSALADDGSSSSSKTTSTKSTKKASATKVASPKASKVKTASAANKSANTEDTATTQSAYNIWSWLLIAAGIATIGYGIYEYRPEIKTHYHKWRAKLGTSRKAR